MEPRWTDRTSIGYEVDGGLDLRHARWLRGAIAGREVRPEFHDHDEDGLVCRHPLIRYDVSSGVAVITGLAEGSLLLRSMPVPDTLHLGPSRYPVLGRTMETDRVPIGPTPEPIHYQFRSPYLALNQENHVRWEQDQANGRRELLERVLIGNLLSLSRAIGLHVEERLRAEVDLELDGWHEMKPGVRLLGFRGTIRVNYLIPVFWGIGKSSARGFGTLTREGESHGQGQQ